MPSAAFTCTTLALTVPAVRLPAAPALRAQAEAKGPSKDTQRELDAIEMKLPQDHNRPAFMSRAVAALLLLKRAAQEAFTRLCQERGRSLTASILPMMLDIKVRAGMGYQMESWGCCRVGFHTWWQRRR